MGKAVGGGIYGMDESVTTAGGKPMEAIHLSGHMNPAKWNTFKQELDAFLKAKYPNVVQDVVKIKPSK